LNYERAKQNWAKNGTKSVTNMPAEIVAAPLNTDGLLPVTCCAPVEDEVFKVQVWPLPI
jgi:hypothetical protein